MLIKEKKNGMNWDTGPCQRVNSGEGNSLDIYGLEDIKLFHINVHSFSVSYEESLP